LRRLLGDRRQNLSEALELHKTVLADRVARGAEPQLLSRSRLAMGNVHYETALLDRPPETSLLNDAIDAYAAAFAGDQEDAFPKDAALARMLEGQARTLLPDTPAGRSAAIACFDRAELLATVAGSLDTLEDVLRRRGSHLFRLKDWQGAIACYRHALLCRRELVAQALSGLGQQRTVEALSPYVARLAYALARTGRLNEALNEIDRGRALDLRAALRGIDVGTDGEAAGRYREARRSVARLEAAEREAAGRLDSAELVALHERLAEARRALSAAADALTVQEDSSAPSGYQALLATVDPDELLAVPIVTDMGTLLVCACHRDPKAWPDNVFWLDDFTQADARRLIGPPADAGRPAAEGNKPKLVDWGSVTRQLAASSSAAMPAAARSLHAALQALDRTSLVGALRERLKETGCRALTLVPHAGLQVLPLHLAAGPARDGAALVQTVALDSRIWLRPSTSGPGLTPRAPARPHVLVAANPTGNLPFAAWEAEVIRHRLGDHATVEILLGSDATADAVLQRFGRTDVFHFAGHGAHDWNEALRSGVICADRALTVQELRAAGAPSRLRLVVLSACESGLTETARLPDEFIGLPAAFFALGARAVVSSLWVVPDESTALLMSEFYFLALVEKQRPAQALAEAQRRISAGTSAELGVATTLGALYEAGGRRDPQLARRALAHRRRPAERPFASPLYWGAHRIQSV
jgi:hypothetical protein